MGQRQGVALLGRTTLPPGACIPALRCFPKSLGTLCPRPSRPPYCAPPRPRPPLCAPPPAPPSLGLRLLSLSLAAWLAGRLVPALPSPKSSAFLEARLRPSLLRLLSPALFTALLDLNTPFRPTFLCPASVASLSLALPISLLLLCSPLLPSFFTFTIPLPTAHTFCSAHAASVC